MSLPRDSSLRTFLLLTLGCLLSPVAMADASDDAADFLVFESVTDGRCQNLSDGGKLRIMRNQHTDAAIDYRLMRIFVGKPQGRSVGVAAPGNTVVKLGCTRVDGREQDWIVERARFQADKS